MEFSCVVDPEFSRTAEDEREDTLNEWTNERMGSAGNSSALRFPTLYTGTVGTVASLRFTTPVKYCTVPNLGM